MTKFIYKPFFLLLLPELLSILSDWFMLSNLLFITHIIKINLLVIQLGVLFMPYFLYDLKNLSTASLLNCNSSVYIVKLGLVTKKEELLKTSLYLNSYLLLSLSLLTLMLSKCIAISK